MTSTIGGRRGRLARRRSRGVAPAFRPKSPQPPPSPGHKHPPHAYVPLAGDCDPVSGLVHSGRRRRRPPHSPPRWTSPASSATCPVVRVAPAGGRRGRSRRPCPSPAAQRTARPAAARRGRGPRRARRRRRRASQRSSARSSRLERRLDRARFAARACRRGRGAPAGSPRRASATLTPIPTTAQRSCGRPSTRIPATLRRRRATSFGHLIRGVRPDDARPPRPRAASGSSRGGSRITIEHSSARPAGALQVRPWRPRPADCSAAVTSVPCGAPRVASSRARALVESVRR